MKEVKIFTPEIGWDNEDNKTTVPLSIFLGGSIDNGEALDWQQAIINEISKEETKTPITIYNPRRKNWNKDATNDELNTQIGWELHHLEKSKLIIMNILGGSKSPISLLELGLFAKENKLIVFCPPTFYRFNNVKVTCEKYDVPLFETNDILVLKNEILKIANYGV